MKLCLLFLMLVFTQAAEVTTTWGTVGDAVRYHIYGTTNGVTREFTTVEAPTNTARFPIKVGVPHKFFVTAENIARIESGPSPSVTFTYPIGLPSVPYAGVRSSAGTTTNAWKDVVVYWPLQSQSVAIKRFYVHFETGSTTNIYALQTNVFVMKTLPFNSYRIYVQAENMLGMSPYRSNSVINLNRSNGKKLLEQEK